MSDTTILAAEAKANTGTGAARAARRQGRVPGIVYGGGAEPQMVTVERRELHRYLHQPGFYSRLFELQLDGTTQRVIARDVQLHPVTDQPVHVDFLRVAAGAQITVAVPVHFVNEDRAPGIRRGGLLNTVRHEIEIYCPADAIPDAITVDLTGLEIGDTIHISRVALPEGVTPVIDRDFTVATIVAPSVMREEAAPQAVEAPAETEATEQE